MGDYHLRGCGERFGESETGGKSRRRRHSGSGAAGQPFSFALFCVALLFALATACLTPAAEYSARI